METVSKQTIQSVTETLLKNNYLCVLGAFNELHPNEFKELGGIVEYYNPNQKELGILGCYFDSQHKEKIQSLNENLMVIDQPLAEGEIFEDKKNADKIERLTRWTQKIEQEIEERRKSFGIEAHSTHGEILAMDRLKANGYGVKLIESIKKYQSLSKTIDKLKSTHIVPAIKDPSDQLDKRQSNFQIKFINELEKNLLLEEAPEAPNLITIIKNGKHQTFLRKGIVCQLVGAGGIGKTHFLTQLALSIATGKTFLNNYHINEKGSVFLGLGENADDDIHRLLRKVSKRHTKEDLEEASKRIAAMSFSGKASSFIDKDGSESDSFKQFLDALKTNEPKDGGWALIILDPISRFLGADAENDNASATFFISLLERFTIDLKGKPTVIFGHHMSKSSLGETNTDQTAARGSSAITDGVRWQANLEKVKSAGDSDEFDLSRVSFKVVKSNFSEITAKHILLKGSDGLLDHDPEPPAESSHQTKKSDINKRNGKKKPDTEVINEPDFSSSYLKDD